MLSSEKNILLYPFQRGSGSIVSDWAESVQKPEVVGATRKQCLLDTAWQVPGRDRSWGRGKTRVGDTKKWVIECKRTKLWFE